MNVDAPAGWTSWRVGPRGRPHVLPLLAKMMAASRNPLRRERGCRSSEAVQHEHKTTIPDGMKSGHVQILICEFPVEKGDEGCTVRL